jgi:hypothetical protein
VPGKGLEPSCLAALAPKASASTNFATRAYKKPCYFNTKSPFWKIKTPKRLNV